MPQFYQDAGDDALTYERIESFGGGMDGFMRSVLLPADVSREMVNLLVRDNFEAGTRPGVAALGGAGPAGPGARVQGMAWFDTPTTKQLVVAAGGAVWAWTGSEWLRLSGWTLPDTTSPWEAAQGVDRLLCSDGRNAMQSWDGATWTIETSGNEVMDPPVGATILCWHAGRMFAAGFPGGVAGKEEDALWASNLLGLGGATWNRTEQQMRVGTGSGDPIRALVSFTGFQLAILKEASVWLLNSDPRVGVSGWNTAVQAESVSSGVGCVGKRACCVFGNDVLFMAQDGVRSLARMQAAAGQYEVGPPLSQPMQPYIDRINWEAASGICARKYKELALFAVPLDNSAVNNAVLVWNGRLQRWMGAWTGWNPSAFEVTRFAGAQALVIGDESGSVNRWQEGAPRFDDGTYLDNGAQYPTKLWTRSMLFGEPVNNKVGYHSEVRIAAGNARISVAAVADDVVARAWSGSVTPAGPTLPATLPFDLGAAGPLTIRRGLRGLADFNEIYLRIESASGWWLCRNVTVAAFVTTLDTVSQATPEEPQEPVVSGAQLPVEEDEGEVLVGAGGEEIIGAGGETIGGAG